MNLNKRKARQRRRGDAQVTVWGSQADDRSPKRLDFLSLGGEATMRSCGWPDSTTRRALRPSDKGRIRGRADGAPSQPASQRGGFESFSHCARGFSLARELTIAFEHHAKGVHQILPRFFNRFALRDCTRNFFHECGVTSLVCRDIDGCQIHAWQDRFARSASQASIRRRSLNLPKHGRTPLRKQRVRVQRRTNLRDWEDWKTVTPEFPSRYAQRNRLPHRETCLIQ